MSNKASDVVIQVTDLARAAPACKTKPKQMQKAANPNKPKANKRNERRGPQPADLAHFTESRRWESLQNRPAGGLCCVLHYFPLYLFFFKRTQREEEKEPQTKPHCNQLWEKKPKQTNNPPPKPQTHPQNFSEFARKSLLPG